VPIGPLVRSSLGRFERPATDLYRSLFFNVSAFVRGVRTHAGAPKRILEIGCGAGIVTEHLSRAFPDADVTAIDICDNPGSMCALRGRTRFLKMTAAELSATRPQAYDLIVISDVLHHVPKRDRGELLARAADLSARGGVVVLKEWIRQRTPAYVMGYCSDRFITGDDVHFMSEAELGALARGVFGAGSVRSQFRVAPWACNLALVITANPSTAA
jgi:cyclopropane fatty-acyl-phospholipid synthase-like methyltransferase